MINTNILAWFEASFAARMLNLQSGSLEQIIVALELRRLESRIIKSHTSRQTKSPILVDLGNFLDNVVVESVEGHHQSTNARWLSQEPPLRERVFLEHSVLKCPDRVLLLLVVAV